MAAEARADAGAGAWVGSGVAAGVASVVDRGVVVVVVSRVGWAGIVPTGPGAPRRSVGRKMTTAEANAAVFFASPNVRRPRT